MQITREDILNLLSGIDQSTCCFNVEANEVDGILDPILAAIDDVRV